MCPSLAGAVPPRFGSVPTVGHAAPAAVAVSTTIQEKLPARVPGALTHKLPLCAGHKVRRCLYSWPEHLIQLVRGYHPLPAELASDAIRRRSNASASILLKAARSAAGMWPCATADLLEKNKWGATVKDPFSLEVEIRSRLDHALRRAAHEWLLRPAQALQTTPNNPRLHCRVARSLGAWLLAPECAPGPVR